LKLPLVLGLEAAVRKLRAEAALCSDLILSDSYADKLGAEYSYIPPLLAVGAVHHHLIRSGAGMKASIVVNTSVLEYSPLCFLIGYGASAVCPYLALETVRSWWSDPKTQQFMERGKIPAFAGRR